MVPLLSLIGILAGWLLVIVLGVTAGYGLVVAWQRWGDRLPLPAKATQVTERVLGPANVTPATAGPVADAIAETDAIPPGEAPQETSPEVPEPAESTPGLAGEAGEEHGPAPSPDPAAHASGDPTQPSDEPPERELEARYTLERADAIEEISALFDAPYEQANALVKSGLWGMENHEEWARAMRERSPPPGVNEELFRRIVNTSPKDYEGPLERLREKSHALKAFRSLWGVGPQEAEALFEAGFRDLESIRNTSTDKLAKTPGIGHALAFQIRAAAHGLAPTA